MRGSDRPPFYTRYGFARTGDRDAPLEIEPYPEICEGGALLATIAVSAVDLVGGLFTREIAGADATFTTDLSLRIPAPGRPERLVARGERLRAGRSLVTTEVRLESDAGLYAFGQTTFTRRERQGERRPDVSALSLPETLERHPLSRPLIEEVGIETVEPSRGRVRLALGPEHLNPEGTLQGALVALIVEASARALAGHARAEPGRGHLEALDLRYLAAASKGPLEATADWIGPPDAGMMRILLRDGGREDRITTAGLARVRAGGPPARD